MWWFFYKPWNKDPVIKQPGFNGKLEFFFVAQIDLSFTHTFVSMEKKSEANVIPCPNRKWQSYLVNFEYISRWWFQIFVIFTPIWGRFPFWLIFFKWVVQPPTRYSCEAIEGCMWNPESLERPEVRKDYFLSSSRGTWSRKRGQSALHENGCWTKNREISPQIIHSNKGFPLFSPSILGFFPLIFGNTQMQGLDHYDGYPIHLWPQGIGDFFFVDGWLQWMVHLQLEWEWHMTGWWGKWFFEPPKNQVGVYHTWRMWSVSYLLFITYIDPSWGLFIWNRYSYLAQD